MTLTTGASGSLELWLGLGPRSQVWKMLWKSVLLVADFVHSTPAVWLGADETRDLQCLCNADFTQYTCSAFTA